MTDATPRRNTGEQSQVEPLSPLDKLNGWKRVATTVVLTAAAMQAFNGLGLCQTGWAFVSKTEAKTLQDKNEARHTEIEKTVSEVSEMVSDISDTVGPMAVDVDELKRKQEIGAEVNMAILEAISPKRAKAMKRKLRPPHDR